MWELIKKEPVILKDLVVALIALGVAFGLPLSDEQKVAIIGVVVVVGSILSRSRVSPS